MKASQLHVIRKWALCSFLALVALYGLHYRSPSVSYERQELDLESVHVTRLSNTFLSCMEEVGVNLPVRKDGQFAAHHYDAGNNDKWNEGIRFNTFEPPLPQHALVLDIGGNTKAADSRVFHTNFPGAEIHIYEPVPEYFDQLKSNWADLPDVSLHKLGLGNSTRTVYIPTQELAGESTFVMEGGRKGSETNISLEIVDGEAELRRFLEGRRKMVDLLHMNCEGCEWELLERLAGTQMLQHIRYVQVSFHNYGKDGIGRLLPKYCLIREALEKTHKKVVAVPFAWERWSIKQ